MHCRTCYIIIKLVKVSLLDYASSSPDTVQNQKRQAYNKLTDLGLSLLSIAVCYMGVG